MKTHFIGFVLVAFGFVVGFFCGLLWAARGIRNKNEDEIFEDRLLKINRVREWPDPPLTLEECESARDAHGGKAGSET